MKLEMSRVLPGECSHGTKRARPLARFEIFMGGLIGQAREIGGTFGGTAESESTANGFQTLFSRNIRPPFRAPIAAQPTGQRAMRVL